MKNYTNTNPKKIGLYDPYLDTLGGGEKHILSILQALDLLGLKTTIFWDKDISDKITDRLNITFNNISFTKNIFINKSSLQRLNALQDFDLFFYVTDGSYFVSSAKKTYIFCMVPDKKLYRMHLINKIKTANSKFISNSIFTYRCLAKWGIKSFIIHPYIQDDFFQKHIYTQKQNIILSVGRFFPHLHSKRQDLAIDYFIKLKKLYPQFKDYQLHLAGSVNPKDQDYIKELRVKSAHDPSIVFHVNIPYEKLINLYQKARYYWHFAGFGIDEDKFPQNTEHLGITPLEAMASGCLVLAYKAGGPKELIYQGKNGYLFDTKEQLFFLMDKIFNNVDQQKKVSNLAQIFIKENFSYSTFVKRVQEVIL